jgi:hypothetical protein
MVFKAVESDSSPVRGIKKLAMVNLLGVSSGVIAGRYGRLVKSFFRPRGAAE